MMLENLSPWTESAVENATAIHRQREQLRSWLGAHKDTYDAAVEKWNDTEWCQDGLDICAGALRCLEEYNPKEDRPEAGLVSIGKAVISMRSVFGQVQMIEDYQEVVSQLQLFGDSPDDDAA